MKVTVTKYDGCKAVIGDNRDIFIFKAESLGRDMDPASGRGEHRLRRNQPTQRRNSGNERINGSPA